MKPTSVPIVGPDDEDDLFGLLLFLLPEEMDDLREIALSARARGFTQVSLVPDLRDRAERLFDKAWERRVLNAYIIAAECESAPLF